MTVAIAVLFLPSPQAAPALQLRRFPAAEATQGVAVDKGAFYAVANATIGKYDKRTGRKLAEWKGERGGSIIHLDSGTVIGNKLYCAHSNFPALPMQSTVEVWDTRTMTHIESHSLGLEPGSATWIEWHDGAWWIAFANYNGSGGAPGRGNEFSYLARYDGQFRKMAAYTYPPSWISRWDGMSNSGGVWLRDGTLLLSPHHAPELYVARLPKSGTVLEPVRVIPVEPEGQGIALDPDGRTIWAIQRRTREVLSFELPK